MKLSNAGLQAIIKREGIILHTYKDSVGVLTIGTGHTSEAGPPKVVPGMVITRQENDAILARDLAPIEKQVNDTVKVPITQNQFDALVSIIFNVGPKFLTSTCMKKLNARDYKGAADAIMMWNKPPEIIGRRATEKAQFLRPDTPDSTKSTSATTGVVIAGTAAAATAPHHYLPYIIGGTVIVAVIAWLAFRIHEYRKAHLDVPTVPPQN